MRTPNNRAGKNVKLWETKASQNQPGRAGGLSHVLTPVAGGNEKAATWLRNWFIRKWSLN
jgi:hypothetical protein